MKFNSVNKFEIINSMQIKVTLNVNKWFIVNNKKKYIYKTKITHIEPRSC